MGKRKLHDTHFYQCDWTGFAMQESNCFMPNWTLEGKLIKKGSYCNWESVLAHARYSYEVDKQMEEKDLQRIVDFVNATVGETVTTDAPYFTDLEHVKPGELKLSATQYHERCSHQSNPISGVLIDVAGNASEITLEPHDGVFDFAFAMPPAQDNAPLQCFRSYRKGKNNSKELSVMHFSSGAINTLASSLFKMQIFGPVLMVQYAKEASFLPRTRYVHFTLKEFEENFTRKRKRGADAAVDKGEYSKLKEKMQTSLAAFEARASSLSAPAPSCQMPRADGHQLAALVTATA